MFGRTLVLHPETQGKTTIARGPASSAVGAEPMISAGDVEKYGYCPLNWWRSLGKDDGEGPEIEAGRSRHEEIARDLKGIEVHEHRAKESETIVLYYALAATFVAVLGAGFVVALAVPFIQIVAALSLLWLLAALYFLYQAERVATDEERMLTGRAVLIASMVATVLATYAASTSLIANPLLAAATEAAALVWLIGASAFLSRSLRAQSFAAEARTRHGIGARSLGFVDDERGKPKLFVSERYGLRGRPDYVLVEGDRHIPVEVKTGRTPRGPLFSHILQIAAYCLLLEDNYGAAPPHGILRYGGASHEIAYNGELKSLLLGKLKEMGAALRDGGGVHRNHNRPGKCFGCSRREGCPERLA